MCLHTIAQSKYKYKKLGEGNCSSQEETAADWKTAIGTKDGSEAKHILQKWSQESRCLSKHCHYNLLPDYILIETKQAGWNSSNIKCSK